MKTKTISTIEMTHEEWLATRQRGIGSSDVAAILGLNKFRTPLDVWKEKITDDVPKQAETKYTKFGKRWEDEVADLFVEEKGLKVLRDNKIRVHPGHPFMICNLDRVILPKNGEGRGVLEAKTTTAMRYPNWREEIPPEFFVQVQHQLYVTGWSWGWLAILLRDSLDTVYWPIERDDEYVEDQNKQLFAFWDKVVNKVPPDPVLQDVEAMISRAVTVEADNQEAAWVQELQELRKTEHEAHEAADVIVEQLKLKMGTAEALAFKGQVLVTYKTAKSSTVFDSKRFQAEQPTVAEKYMIERPGARRFYLKAQREDNQ